LLNVGVFWGSHILLKIKIFLKGLFTATLPQMGFKSWKNYSSIQLKQPILKAGESKIPL
jgi:hypothetical protein